MGCHHGTRFRRDVLARCDAWAAPRCQGAVQRAAARYGPQCLRVRLYSALESPPIAAYVCPHASAGLRALCQDVAPASTGGIPGPAAAAPAAGPGIPPGPAAPAGHAVGIVGATVGSVSLVGGLYKVDKLLMGQEYQGRPATTRVSSVPQQWADPIIKTNPAGRRDAVQLAFSRAKGAIERARQPTGKPDNVHNSRHTRTLWK